MSEWLRRQIRNLLGSARASSNLVAVVPFFFCSCVCGVWFCLLSLASFHCGPFVSEGDWSSGMIPASGAGGREFDSRITPFLVRGRQRVRVVKEVD